MYSFKNVDIMKEVDSFIAQAKLEGEISGSSSSNVSLKVHSTSTNMLNIDNLRDSLNQMNGNIQLGEETTESTNISTTVDKVIPTTQCFLEHEKNNSPTKDQQIYDNNIHISNYISDNDSLKEGYCNIKSDKNSFSSSDRIDDSQSPNINYENKFPEYFHGKEDEDSCGSSFVDLGSESNRSKMPYVMWLQQRRSRQNLLNNLIQDGQTEEKDLQREEVHLHQVNSALFWERWIDQVFDMYDQWVQSSDSDDNTSLKKSHTSKEAESKNRPTKIRSEPIIRTQSDESMMTDLKYKCPSYVDWLVQRRQEKTEISDNEEIIESKINNNYWSSLYGKLTKSLSSIFLSSRTRREEDISREQAQAIPPVIKSLSRSPSRSPRVTSTSLRRSHSHSCSYHCHGFNQASKLRGKQLSQESVGSPVLTDQLVELVCNTLSPESTDSSTDEDIRRRKPYKRVTKRKY